MIAADEDAVVAPHGLLRVERRPGVGLAVSATYARVPGVGRLLSRIFSQEPVAAWALTQLHVGVGWLVFFYPVADAARMARQLFSP